MQKLDKIINAYIEQKEYKKELNNLSKIQIVALINLINRCNLPYQIIGKKNELIIRRVNN